MKCLNAGARIVVHDTVRDECARIARLALPQPAVGVYLWPGRNKSRMDLAYVVDDVCRVADFAVTSPIGNPASEHRSAQAPPGGHATWYERTKVKTYGPKIAASHEAGHQRQTLAPVVIDTLGAYSKGATAWFKELVLCLAARYNNPARFHEVFRRTMHRISFVIARSIARLINAWTLLSPNGRR